MPAGLVAVYGIFSPSPAVFCVFSGFLRIWHGNCFKGGETKKWSNLEQFQRAKPFNRGSTPKRIRIMIKPLADRIVVKPAEAEQKTSSGLFIPDNAKEKPMQGKVVAVGPGRKNDKGEVVAMEVKVGDVVLYGKYSGTEVTVDGENYLIVKESDVIATL